MTTLASSSLPVPDSLVVGGGSYVVPVNRYGFLSMSASSAIATGAYVNSAGSPLGGAGGGGSSANNNQQWVTPGTSISVSSSFPAAGPSQGASRLNATSFARVLLNGQATCVSYARGEVGGTPGWVSSFLFYSSTGEAAWSLALYRIPKGNLPIGAAEGE